MLPTPAEHEPAEAWWVWTLILFGVAFIWSLSTDGPGTLADHEPSEAPAVAHRPILDPPGIPAPEVTPPAVREALNDLRSFYARRLNERRQDEQVQAVEGPPVATEASTVPVVTTTAPPSTTTTVDTWEPADECGRVPRHYINDAVMAYCPMVAAHLNNWTWDPGDLTFYLTVMMCESRGDPEANERNWGTGPRAVWGLFSHRREYWAGRSLLALGRPGVIGDDHDDLHVAIWLVESGHQAWTSAWDGCESTIRANL